MLRSRIIPCLLVHDKGLVKTVKFKDPKYVGDPINAVKIFNEKHVDELILLDIDASRENREPNYEMIENIAKECRMPFCYGGGVKNAEIAKKIINLGAEKVAVSTEAITNPAIIDSIAEVIGAQSVIVVIDILKKKGFLKSDYEIMLCNGTRKSGLRLEEYLKTLSERNVGEVVVNSIDRDGTMLGYDMELIDIVRNSIDCPITALGGASSVKDIAQLVDKYKIIGAAAGSLFVFVGKYRAVLINYPDASTKHRILKY